jgi:hypothetical protein
MHEHDGRYAGPAGILFTEDEIRQIYAVLRDRTSSPRWALQMRIASYLDHLDATRSLDQCRVRSE